VAFQGRTDQHFVVDRAVEVACVEQGDACIDGGIDRRQALLVIAFVPVKVASDQLVAGIVPSALRRECQKTRAARGHYGGFCEDFLSFLTRKSDSAFLPKDRLHQGQISRSSNAERLYLRRSS
jgi:hypothetical protein